MRSVFLSHSSADKPFTRRLAHRLQKVGIKVWLDEAELKIGDSLLTKLGEAIHDNDFVAAVLSKTSIASRWVQKELQLAMAKELDTRNVVVLPLVIDNVPLPPYLTDKIYADFRAPGLFADSFSRLLVTLGVATSLEDAAVQVGADDLDDVFSDRYAIRSRAIIQRNRVLIFWQQHGITRSDALHLAADLSSVGIMANIVEHRDPRPPDAIFIARDTPAFVVARVVSSLPYIPSYIYPESYSDLQCGAPSEYSISVGLHSDFHKSKSTQLTAHPLSEQDFHVLCNTNG